MEFQRNSLFLSLPTAVLHMCSSLGADCNTLPRDAVFASATINCSGKTFLELGSFPATPFPKSTHYWPAKRCFNWSTCHHFDLKTSKEALRWGGNSPCTPVGFGSFVYPKTQILFSHTGFYNRVTAPDPLASVHTPSSSTEKWCSLIWYSQTLLNPRVLGSSWTVQNQGKYKVTTCGVLRA